jgi:hypothetical protein
MKRRGYARVTAAQHGCKSQPRVGGTEQGIALAQIIRGRAALSVQGVLGLELRRMSCAV